MMEFELYASDGTLLWDHVRPDDRGRITLPSYVEQSIWGRESIELHRRIAHMEALKSRDLHWSGDGSGPTLKDGTPVTEEMMESWGWQKNDDGWSLSGEWKT